MVLSALDGVMTAYPLGVDILRCSCCVSVLCSCIIWELSSGDLYDV